ncbi:isochorismatase family protein [Alkalihalobacillus sp. MEB130]|uniref:cysteine hydrolase family protein n=1 Tax=Alkalihalobacillus sp. MEB130 TaxID=2976704 RepID=UPI0028DD8957|nr:isochorismatase family protein [Alkalihalobacillus sp. MEB130]MDT8858924.1 isochorismatase family protein [Alkalihalobacillus sp. MEB130]
MNIEEIWKDVLLEDDEQVISKGGFGKPRGLGSRPALIVIDAQPNYVGDNKPILDQIEQFPTGVGEKAWTALEKTLPVIKLFREKELPVIFTRQIAKYTQFDNFAGKKALRDRSIYEAGHSYTEIVSAIENHLSDIIIDKSYASAFVGTPLVNYLIKLQVDTLIFCGGVTSGCVRSAVVDAASLNYKVGILHECVFDRMEISHRISLLDMWMKYSDLLSVDQVFDYITTGRDQ